MGNLIEIQGQIEKLTKQANEIKAREFDKTVLEILAKMNAFGISLKDLQPNRTGRGIRSTGRSSVVSATKKSGAKIKSKRVGTIVAPKYRGPSGDTWSGRGLMPRWLSALVADGKTKEDFAIKT